VRPVDLFAGGGYIEMHGEPSTKGVNDDRLRTSGRAGAAGRPQADRTAHRAADRAAL